MVMSRAEAYKNRRIAAAIRGGFARTGRQGTAREKDRLKKGLSRLWDKYIGSECPLQCGTKLTPRRTAFCHNIALASGGSHSISNIFLACGSCNRSQKTLTTDQYLKLRQVIIDHFGDEIWKKVKRWMAGAKH